MITAATVVTNQPGTYAVTWTATNSVALSGSATRTVRVVDTTPPSITLPGNMVVHAATISGAAGVFTTSATDFVSGSVATVNTPASGTLFPIGVTNVTARATDGAGNVASGTFTLTVTPPCGAQASLSPQIKTGTGSVNLTVKPSTFGRLYQMQFSSDMSNGSWQDVGTEQMGAGGDLILSLPSGAPETRGFYRLKLR